jgi:hypothetical protein
MIGLVILGIAISCGFVVAVYALVFHNPVNDEKLEGF